MLELLVRQFNQVYNVPSAVKPKLPTAEEQARVLKLIQEEVEETKEALVGEDIVHLAKELGDIIYVTAQQAVTLGIPIDAVLREIQSSNLSKLDDEGLPIFREDGKVLKGPNFFKAEKGITKVLTHASEHSL